MQKTTIRYWYCQLLGWGGWTLLNLSFFYFFLQDYYWKIPERKSLLLIGLFIQLSWFIISTHLLRSALKKSKWLKFSTNKVIGLFIIGVFLTGLLCYYGAKITVMATGTSLADFEKKTSFKEAVSREQSMGIRGTAYFRPNKNNLQDSLNNASKESIKRATGWYRDTSGKWQYNDQRQARFWWDLIFTFILIALWLLIYMVWHYLERNRKNELSRLTLQKTVKDLELKTIKSHINPHFIFNSLNSIRALVDENPQRARTAITELSNILRSSLQVEKMETVPLQKELDIVKDYLGLEQMRFEERLKVEMDIDEDTLDQQVPPMMLQTLVENAIKHGISKRIGGGTVKIISEFDGRNFKLAVQNTGNLEAKPNDGFGFKSTRDRLKFLRDGKAYLKVEQIEPSKVQAMIVMPLEY